MPLRKIITGAPSGQRGQRRCNVETTCTMGVPYHSAKDLCYGAKRNDPATQLLFTFALHLRANKKTRCNLQNG